MKQWNIIKKNFKVLLRSKSSAFVVLIGPLLIIALISVAFSNTQDYSISVGIVAPDREGLTDQFISQLEKGEYSITYYEDIDECIEHVRLQTTNLCIDFPPNFVLGNDKTFDLGFHVDQSRINIVESIVSSVRSSITVKSDEITLGLTNNLIETIELTEEEIGKQKQAVEEITVKLSTSGEHASTIKERGERIADGLDVNTGNAQTISASIDLLKVDIDKVVTELDGFIDDAEAAGVDPTDMNAAYGKLKNSSAAEPDKIKTAAEDIKNAINEITQQVGSGNDGLIGAAKSVKEGLDTITTRIGDVKASIRRVEDRINQIEITNADSIINPFTINVNPVSAISQQSTLMFPYFVTLIILLVGIMLSSTLVVMEKKSRAFFRTFTTPTSELSHILAEYITNLSVIIFQLAVVFIPAFYYLQIPVMNNPAVTLTILFLSVSFFIMLGTLIGYMFTTQEGTTIASISIGSLFLFLSNLILPIESFPELIREILRFNPFTLCAEMFKKSMLFSASFNSLKADLVVLGVYVIATVILVVIFQKISFNRLFSGFSNKKVLQRPHILENNMLALPDGSLLKSKQDLVHALRKMDDDIFSKFVTKKNHEFSLWIRDAFKEKKLAKRVKKAKSQQSLISVLEDHLKDPLKDASKYKIQFKMVK